jgi:hypothetical protein
VAGREKRLQPAPPVWPDLGLPGFVLELPFGRHQLDLGFRSEILRYVELTNQDTEHYVVLGTPRAA